MSMPKVIEQWGFLSNADGNDEFNLLNRPLYGAIQGKDTVTSPIIGKTADGLGVVTSSDSVYVLGAPHAVVAAKYPDFQKTVLSRLPHAVGHTPEKSQGGYEGSLDLSL